MTIAAPRSNTGGGVSQVPALFDFCFRAAIRPIAHRWHSDSSMSDGVLLHSLRV